MGHYVIFMYQPSTSLLLATFALLFGPVDMIFVAFERALYYREALCWPFDLVKGFFFLLHHSIRRRYWLHSTKSVVTGRVTDDGILMICVLRLATMLGWIMIIHAGTAAIKNSSVLSPMSR